MHRVVLPYGVPEPLTLEVGRRALVAELAGPAGVRAADAERLVAMALAEPADGPPLASHVVPGDRVVIAVSDAPPQAQRAVEAVTAALLGVGVDRDDLAVLHAGGELHGLERAAEFEPGDASATSYLAADEAGEPLHLARALVDADVVVTVGAWAFDASLGGRSLDGELWPAFGRLACQDALLHDLAGRGRRALRPWLANLEALTWQLGVMACLRLVAGRDDSLAYAAFAPPASAARQARRAAAEWAPLVSTPAECAVCSLSASGRGFAAVSRAVAAAARITAPGGTICIAAPDITPPGPVLTRWRQGAPLVPLLREARRSGDRELVADAALTILLARALDDRRLVLLSNLDETTVEELAFGYAATPEAIARLATRATSVAALHEADRLFPSLA